MEGQEMIPGIDPVHGLGEIPCQIPDVAQEYRDGWTNLVERAHAEIVAVDRHYRAHQVKEKFGGLRLYLSGRPEIFPIAEKYELESYTICELCGEPGRLCHLGYWAITLCPECGDANRPTA